MAIFVAASLLLILPTTRATATLRVTVRALYSAPRSSVASYLVTPKAVRLSAVISWEPRSTVDGWILEASVRHEASSGDWFDWEPAATLAAHENDYMIPVEPGLAYRFRLAGLSDAEGRLPFGVPTLPISALGDPQQVDTEAIVDEAERQRRANAALAALQAGDASPAASPPPTPSSDVMPWDLPAPAAPPAAPAQGCDLRSGVWSAGEQPLLALVPT